MPTMTVLILVCVAVASIGIWYYARVFLPREMDRRYRDSVRAFGTAIELRYPGQKGSTERTWRLVRAMAQRHNLNSRQMQRLELATRLRDIGLCAIPYKLINEKAATEWSAAEHAIFARHPEVSGAMLELVPSLRHIASIVRYHHAAWDGSDGPMFPARDELPFESRLLCIVTTYVRSEKLYGALLSRQQLTDGAGTKFDPDLVREFCAVLTSDRVEGVPELATAQ